VTRGEIEEVLLKCALRDYREKGWADRRDREEKIKGLGKGQEWRRWRSDWKGKEINTNACIKGRKDRDENGDQNSDARGGPYVKSPLSILDHRQEKGRKGPSGCRATNMRLFRQKAESLVAPTGVTVRGTTKRSETENRSPLERVEY